MKLSLCYFNLLIIISSSLHAMDRDNFKPVTSSNKRQYEEIAPFICSQCSKAFDDELSLTSHQIEKHRARIPAYILEQRKKEEALTGFYCEICKETKPEITYQGLLNNHIQYEHKCCPVCLEKLADYTLASFDHNKEKHPGSIKKIKTDKTDKDEDL